MLRAHIKAAMSLIAASAAASAYAQDPPTATATAAGSEEVEEVVVTGFRASLNAALDDKRDAAGAIDSDPLPRTSPSSRIRTSPNPCSAFRASRSRATRAKAAISPCAAWARSSRACASTAWRR